MPPLIKVKLLLNDTLNISGIYDSGSNVSLINAKLLKIQPKENTSNIQTVNLKTINGEKNTKGMVTLKIKIYDIEKNIDVFVVDSENFNYDFLIGLDCIKKFKLMQNEQLEIIQYKNPRGKNITLNEEDIKNKNYSKNNTSKPTNVKVPDVLGDKNEAITHMNKCEINFNEHIPTHGFEMSVNHLELYQQSEIDKLIEK